MNKEDAINILEKEKPRVSIFDMTPEEIEKYKALSIAITSIKRFKKEKPIVESENEEDSYEVIPRYECPSCGLEIKEYYKKPTFCSNHKCGQAFYW